MNRPDGRLATRRYQNIYDKNQNQAKIELGLNKSNKEQINYATLGNGNITTNSDISTLNRDVNKSLFYLNLFHLFYQNALLHIKRFPAHILPHLQCSLFF